MLAALAVLSLVLIAPLVGRAERSYTVRPGDTIAAIARRHHVPVESLLGANDLDRTSQLRPGQSLSIPDRGVVYVRPGDTLSRIARDNQVTVEELLRENRLRANASLRPGQRLRLPGAEAAEEVERAERRWGRPRNAGVVEIVRVQSEERLRIRLVDERGRARRAALRRLAPLMRARRSTATREPHRRLVGMLAQISDHFGGRTLYIVSGFRPPGGYTRDTSQHAAGRAADIRVRGVPNTAVRDYCRTLDRAGCGFYPRSTFVHVDARSENAYWVDMSGPGERPAYRRGQARGPEGELEGEEELEGDEGAESGVATTATHDEEAEAADAAEAAEAAGATEGD